MLDKYIKYDNIEKNCYEFQTYSCITRIKSVIDEIYNCQDADIYILERSIWTDKYIFMELLKEIVGGRLVGHGLLDRILRNNPDASGSFGLLHHDCSIVSYNQHSIENVRVL